MRERRRARCSARCRTAAAARAAFFAAIAHGHGADLRRRRRGRAPTRSARRSRSCEASRRPARRPARCSRGRRSAPLWLREADAGRDADRPGDRAGARAQRRVGRAPAMLLPPRPRPGDDRPLGRRRGATIDEAIGLARETGQRTELARALAGPGLARGAPGQASELPRARRRGAGALRASSAIGTLRDLGARGARRPRARPRAARRGGRAPEASRPLRSSARHRRRRPLAGARAGRRLPAARAGRRGGRGRRRRTSAAAEAKGQPWALARAARCRGLLAPTTSVRAGFERGAALHARTPDVFERRARGWPTASGCAARASACAPASSCARRSTTFDRLGAEPWADAGPGRARGHRRDRPPARPEHARRAHPAGAPDRAAARRRA